MPTRRRFCALASAGVLAPLTGCAGDLPAPVDTSGGMGGSTTVAGSTGSFACPPSPPDIEGPFYRPDIPVGGDMDIHGDAGLPLIFSGTVTDTDCAPLEGAVVELWHATPVLPDGAPGDVNAEYDGTDAYRYYAQVATDADGRFEFTTLRPGWYLNGSAYRPAHLHLKVWVGDSERLTTQVYFAGDPFNADDTWYNPDMEIDPDADGRASLELSV